MAGVISTPGKSNDLAGHLSVMLPAHQVADNGLRIIKDAPHLATNIRLHVGD